MMGASMTIPSRRSPSNSRRFVVCLSLLGLLALGPLAITGCDESVPTGLPQAPGGQASGDSSDAGTPSRAGVPVAKAAAGSTTSTSSSAYLASKIKFKTNSGETEMSVKPKEDGAKLVDAGEQELARYNIQGDKLKIKDPQDKVLGYIVGAAPRFKVEDASQEKILFKLIGQDDGDWKLEDAGDTLLYKIKRREYGFEIEDPAEKSLYKIKVDGPKTSLRDASDKTVRYTNDPVNPLAFACLALDAIADPRVRAALLVAVQQGP